MKLNQDSRPHLGIPKFEFMKNSSFNFIENERMCNVGQSAPHKTDEIHIRTPHGHHHKGDIIEKSKATTLLNRTEAMPQESLITTEVRNEEGPFMPKRYITTCYFQPKQNPVSYSETVILTLGSSKKHYFDTVMYETKLVPFRWTESMTTITRPSIENECKAHYECFVEEPKYHYLSLEPQQLAAQNQAHKVEPVAI